MLRKIAICIATGVLATMFLCFADAGAETVRAGTDPVAATTCPEQQCEWHSGVDFEGNRTSSWTCKVPGSDTNQSCTWELGDCYHKPCVKASPDYNFGAPNDYAGG